MKVTWISTLLLLITSIVSLNATHDETVGVVKHMLSNGLTVLTRQTDTTQNVAIRLWIRTGSKNDPTDHHGLAHLMEHTLFLGTEKLSQPDIFAVAQKLSGHANAQTDYDHTQLIFDLPRDVWFHALPIFSECLSKCSLKEDYLNSELSAVMQELKMYRDDESRSLLMELLALMYPHHPYGIPVIGYKKDLWNTHEADLKSFYKTYYQPQNAVLVVVGNVAPADVIKQAEEHFGALANTSILPTRTNSDQPAAQTTPIERSITLHRDIVQPLIYLAFKIPGLAHRSPQDAYSMRILQQIVINNETARLEKTLVDELQLVDSITQYMLDLEDSDVSIIAYAPKDEKNIDHINELIFTELNNIGQNGCSLDELQRASKQFETSYYGGLESNASQAAQIGEHYLATGDENYIYHLHIPDLNEVNTRIKEIVSRYFKKNLAYKTVLLPFTDEQKRAWLEEQKKEDEEDARHLAERVRTSEVEGERYAKTVTLPEHVATTYPKPNLLYLNNGIRVLYYQSDQVPTIQFALKLKTPDQILTDDIPSEQFACLKTMMFEGGTRTHSADEMAQKFEHLGAFRGLSMWQLNAYILSDDFPEALSLLYEVIAQPAFDKKALEKVKGWMQTGADEFWKDEAAIAGIMVSSTIENKRVRTLDQADIKNITTDTLQSLYEQIFTPQEAVITIVGDLRQHETRLTELLNQTFGRWQDARQKDASPASIKTHYLDRNQVILTLGGRSLCRFDKDFDALMLYDEHLNQRLFQLREQTGAFYVIEGAMVTGADATSQGSWLISTKISPERVGEVYDLIIQFIKHDIESFDENKLDDARQSRSKAYDQKYASNSALGSSFRSLDRLHLPFDYYEKRADQLKRVTVADVKRVVTRILTPDNIHIALVGRMGPQNLCTQKIVNPFENREQCPATLP